MLCARARISQIADDADPADDGIDCTLNGCSMGAPTSMPAPIGVLCDDQGGLVCDGAGQCVPSVCGDAQVTGGEACDDGNAIDGDGCDAN